MQAVTLTFDLEEFDIPEEYGQLVPEREQMEVTRRGTESLLTLLDQYKVRATFFTTGHYARMNPDLIRAVAERHEIASHALYHSPRHEFQMEDVRESKQILEALTGQEVKGFRMPRLKPFAMEKLLDYGITYDASINPAYLPGRYNLLHENPQPHLRNGLMELPSSTTPLLRLPLFWLSFKNLPAALFRYWAAQTLNKRKVLMLYFHPWEFADIQSYNVPSYVKKVDGERLLQRLEKLIVSLQKQKATFLTCQEYIREMPTGQ
ncbi:polysaccharide deacetylase family protein [Siphonobacter sp. SORGH_AS_1065]|uniref:polysaccharide deacetylase family protein n=1 Tax=Siphonobacter sp. SORGH_AS_1065 TaxID=3041795 RepID=UPI002788A0A9|nr:polysaccharide deacetylase family protein [Siphonobacter sp. SORGH_AS_1065]MDQ1087767.1 peptidoglycan/xylan/chitin deacetylase (PgdA/CDA1 family) [Siphonobacter sp. SORGH_AS_1065]